MNVAEWWASLTMMKQFFLMMAVPSTVVLLIQSVLTFIGIGDHGADGSGSDAGGDGNAFDGHSGLGGALHGGSHDGGPDGHDIGSSDGHDIGTWGSHDIDSSGGHDGHEANIHAQHGMDGFRLFTVRGIVAFLAVFGWTGAALTDAVMPVLVFIFSFFSGLAAMVLIGLAFLAIVRLQAQGNLDYRFSIGLQGEVYLPVPSERTGMGKVNITLQERLIEADAITDDKERLPTGSRIRVVGLSGNNVLLVSKEWEGHPHDA